MSQTVYVVRDASGEYIQGGHDAGAERSARRTPAGDEAHEFETRDEAEAARDRATDRVLAREVE